MLNSVMVSAPQHSPSSLQGVFSPLTYSLLLREHKAEKQYQTVPISPSLSPLQAKKINENASAPLYFLPNNVGPIRASSRDSPVAAIVPGGVSSSSPLQRQMLMTGRKRRRSVSSPHDHSPASPSPIATTSKRFCGFCSNMESTAERSGMVVLSRTRLSNTKTSAARAGQEQVVPDSNHRKKMHQRDLLSINKDGIKQLNLFAGDDIFASHED